MKRLALTATALLGAVALSATLPAGALGPTDWPMFHADPEHRGVSADATLRTSAAPGLTIEWMANTGRSTYTSPAVVERPALGKTLVYQGNQSGTMAAFDAATGDRVWWYRVPAAIQSSPAVVDGVVYFGASDHFLYALDADTGALRCRANTGGVISSSPTVVDPDGSGLVVYFGDNGFSGADDGGNIWAVNAVDPNPAADCSVKWGFNGFGDPPGSSPKTGVWSPPAFGVTRTGVPLVIAGGGSPDCAVYAVNAITGSLVWRYQTELLFADCDVGAGPTISAPGVNGFTDGVAYVAGKNSILYALNLATGAKIWEFRIRDDAPIAGPARSTAALLGNRLYLGSGAGIYAIDATTGAKVWRTPTDAAVEVTASPAIAGPAGDRILFAGDLAGAFYALNPANGAKLWKYQTGNFIYGSPALGAGKVFFGSADGFLYAFGLGGGASAKPTTVIESPLNKEVLAYPAGGDLTISGSASDDGAVRKVLVAIRAINGNKWWDGATGKWTKVFSQNEAALTGAAQPNHVSPEGTAGEQSWSYTFPVPDTGGEFFAQAEAIDDHGQHTAPVPTIKFTVDSAGDPPDTTITSPKRKEVFNFDAAGREVFDIEVTGRATDSGGAKPGIARVMIVVKNLEHSEFYCGPAGCAGGGAGAQGEFSEYSPTYQVYTATLANPGATSTAWTATFPVYDHPHKYRVTAWAVDRDGEPDPTKFNVSPICVRDHGRKSCA